MAKSDFDPVEQVRRLEELLVIWKAPKGKAIDGQYSPIERLIALRNREVETVAMAMAKVERLERERAELLRYLRHLAPTAPPSVKRETQKLLEYYR